MSYVSLELGRRLTVVSGVMVCFAGRTKIEEHLEEKFTLILTKDFEYLLFCLKVILHRI